MDTDKKSLEQPRKHAPKTRMQSHLRRQKLIDGLIKGKAISEIAPTLNLSPQTAIRQAQLMLAEPRTQESFARILHKSGLTDDFLANKIKSLIDAEATIYASHEGQFTDSKQVPALETQRKTTELACRLAGYLKGDAAVTLNNSGLMQVVIAQLAKPE